MSFSTEMTCAILATVCTKIFVLFAPKDGLLCLASPISFHRSVVDVRVTKLALVLPAVVIITTLPRYVEGRPSVALDAITLFSSLLHFRVALALLGNRG